MEFFYFYFPLKKNKEKGESCRCDSVFVVVLGFGLIGDSFVVRMICGVVKMKKTRTQVNTY